MGGYQHLHMVEAPIVPQLPSFRHPPVIETSFGAVFEPLSSMQVRHFGQFWIENRDQYPSTEDQTPLVDGPAEAAIMNIPPLRRMMAYSADQKFALQLQESRIYLNWRRVTPDAEYPRFDAVHTAFTKLFAVFQTFAEREKIGSIKPTRYELVYVNHIPLGADVAGSLEEHVKLFRFSPIKAAYLSPPEAVNSVWKFAMPDRRGTATANLSNGQDKDGQNLLILVLACAGVPSERYSMSDWFESGHEWIVRSFAELTTDSAHKKWERER